MCQCQCCNLPFPNLLGTTNSSLTLPGSHLLIVLVQPEVFHLEVHLIPIRDVQTALTHHHFEVWRPDTPGVTRLKAVQGNRSKLTRRSSVWPWGREWRISRSLRTCVGTSRSPQPESVITLLIIKRKVVHLIWDNVDIVHSRSRF